MLLQGIAPSEIADVLGISPSRLESRRAAMLSALTALDDAEPLREPASAWG
jgi:hypothetical protein